jgi:phosphohistidine swiveling domain-containing protein
VLRASSRTAGTLALVPVITLMRELQTLFEQPGIDVEFAITRDGRLHLLQVRPLSVAQPAVDADIHAARVTRIADKIALGMRPHPFVHGNRTVYGIMPDWNPAEIIGVRPKPLALSLYRELITDATWAYQRNNYGYKNLRSFPLMLHFHGLPYIDVRVSFNSFVPRDIEGSLADRLVNYYIDHLLAAPNLHDKVEFEIVFSCYSLDLPQRLTRLEEAGFSKVECETLAQSLRRLTNRIVHRDTGLWRGDADKLTELEVRRQEVLSADLDPVSRIYWLLEDCKRYGTLPFAGLARAGFIAVQMLRSLVTIGVLSSEDYDRFMGSLNTVSGQMTRDLAQLDRTTFLAKYGHLRPGTYDLLSPRYDEAPDLYFDWSRPAPQPRHAPPFTLSLPQMREIARLLGEHGLEHDVVGLFDFLQAGIELREYAKFVFTRNLSDAMALLRQFGGELGFNQEELAYADIRGIQELHAGSADPRTILSRSIEGGKARYAETCQLVLPPLITAPEEVWAFHLPSSEPNFVTHKTVTGCVVSHQDRARLAGALVAIPNADPGFDWLFSHAIAGFVTAYGGVNSHMAIRANELGLPAVIGAGEALYNRWSQASHLRIDCANRKVEVLG